MSSDVLTQALKSPAEMPFAAFAEAVLPTGAVNRFPSVGPSADLYSYTVYMNGPLSAGLPEYAREYTYNDVTLHALTEKLNLDPRKARDNLKVAEVVALRDAWQSAVLEASAKMDFILSDEVTADYVSLTEGLSHPWIAKELAEQRALSERLRPVLNKVASDLGTPAKDIIPKEVSKGMVVAQDSDFTMQATQDGEVVTHENRRLQTLPAVGAEVSVSYYRGSGQVVASLEKMKVSAPFIDPVSGDLAVRVEEQGKKGSQMVLFNSASGFDKFAKVHGMDSAVVQQALDVRAATPKAPAQQPARSLVKLPYLDPESGCLAIGYTENGVACTAMFRSASEMGIHAQEFGLGKRVLAIARYLDESRGLGADVQNGLDTSLWSITAELSGQGYTQIRQSGADNHQFNGEIVAESAMHVAQHVGRGQVVLHAKDKLNKVPAVGDMFHIKFQDGRGVIADITKPGKEQGR